MVIDTDSKSQFLNALHMTDLAASAIEWAATQDSWRESRQMNRNNFMDQQHLMALVDFFLTDDKKVRALEDRMSSGLPFPIATLLMKADFDARYPG